MIRSRSAFSSAAANRQRQRADLVGLPDAPPGTITCSTEGLHAHQRRPRPATGARRPSFFAGLIGKLYLERIEVSPDEISWRDAIRVIEDYKPLDVQAASMGLALLREVRRRYPEWRYLIDGDGGDENLKDYPIEDNPELTIRSVLGNRMLYQEGWGVDAVKHSLVYSGGQSRGHVRTSAPASKLGFSGFSPYALPDVIEIAEAIPVRQVNRLGSKSAVSAQGSGRGVRNQTDHRGGDAGVRASNGSSRGQSIRQCSRSYSRRTRRSSAKLSRNSMRD